eukprot:gene7864-9717_t
MNAPLQPLALAGIPDPAGAQDPAGGLSVTGATVTYRNGHTALRNSEDVDWNFPVLVEDVVMMGRYGHMNFMRMARAEDRRIAAESLERVNMMEFKDRQIGELSGGQKKRVFLARALAQQGRLILLDEPFTGVDVKTEAAIIDLLRE